VRKDPVVQRSDAWRRIDSELISELCPQRVERAQGIRMTAGPVEGEHHQLAGSLSERIVPDGSRQQFERFRDSSDLETRRRVRLHGSQAFSVSRRLMGWANSS
jgi:hypothetical protein